MPLGAPAAVGLVVQTDGAGAAQQRCGGAAAAWAGQRFSALSSCHRPHRAAPLCCGAAGECLWEGRRVKKADWQCNPSGELLHCSGLACPHCLQPLSAPRACLCTVPSSCSHKCPPIATGSFFAQVAVAVASDDPHQVCSLARPPPAPCPIAFTDYFFSAERLAQISEVEGGAVFRRAGHKPPLQHPSTTSKDAESTRIWPPSALFLDGSRWLMRAFRGRWGAGQDGQ